MRKRLEKFNQIFLPLPPVPLSHFPCGSIVLPYSRLRPILRGGGQLAHLTRYPRFTDRGSIRFDVDFVPSVLKSTTYRDVVEIPKTPRRAEVPAIDAPDHLFDPLAPPTTPGSSPPDTPITSKEKFYTRYEKFKIQCRDEYIRYWNERHQIARRRLKSSISVSSSSGAGGSRSKLSVYDRLLRNPAEYTRHATDVITILCQRMMRATSS
jgi:hypothetical protein